MMLTPHRVQDTLVEHYRYRGEKLQRESDGSQSWSSSGHSKSSMTSSDSWDQWCSQKLSTTEPVQTSERSANAEQTGFTQIRPEATHVEFAAPTCDSSDSAHTDSSSRSSGQASRKNKVEVGSGGQNRSREAQLAQINVEAEQEVPLERQGQLTFESKFALHEARRCIPCALMEVKRYCKDGENCRFCHMSHDDHKMQRPGKEVRVQCKEALKELMDRNFDSEQDREAAIQSLLDRQSPFVRKYTHKLLGESKFALLESTGLVTIPPEVGAGGCSPGFQAVPPKGAKGGKRGQKANSRNLGKGRVSL